MELRSVLLIIPPYTLTLLASKHIAIRRFLFTLRGRALLTHRHIRKPKKRKSDKHQKATVFWVKFITNANQETKIENFMARAARFHSLSTGSSHRTVYVIGAEVRWRKNGTVRDVEGEKRFFGSLNKRKNEIRSWPERWKQARFEQLKFKSHSALAKSH